jgi:hypothetical protein
MRRFVRIIKADEEEEEDTVRRFKRGMRRTAPTNQQLADRLMARYMEKLMKNPPRWKEGEEDDDEFTEVGDIDFGELYDDILFANNNMLADKLGLDEDQRYSEVLDEEGDIAIPSMMSVPIITKRVLDSLDKMIEHFQSEEFLEKEADLLGREPLDGQELQFIKDIDEQDNGELGKRMKTHGVPPDITAWIDNADSPRGKNKLMEYFKEKSRHPLSETTFRSLGKFKERPKKGSMVRVSGRKSLRDIPQSMLEGVTQAKPNREDFSAQYKTPEEQAAYFDEPRKVRADLDRAKKLYEQQVFSSPVFRPGEVYAGKAKEMNKWKRLIDRKAKDEGLSDVKEAVQLVQEDLNKHMRVFLQNRAVGTAGRGGRFGRAATSIKAPDFVTPSFYEQARKMGVTLESRPNAPDGMTEFFLRGDAPNSEKNRRAIARDPPQFDNEMEAHPALATALDEGILYQLGDEVDSKAKMPEVGVSADIKDVGLQERTERGGDRSARGETANLPSVEEMQREVKGTKGGVKQTKLGRYTASTRRGGGQATVAQDSRLLDLDFMLENDMFEGGRDEYNYLRDQVLNDVTGDYRPTYFSEIPHGDDFPEGHPYHKLDEIQIIKEASKFMDDLVGANRRVVQVRGKLRKSGLSLKEIMDLNLNTEDIYNMNQIVNADDPESALNKQSEKNIERYNTCFEAGVTQQFLNKAARDAEELRNIAEQFGIDPIDIADMGARYANSGFTKEGFDQAFASMFGKLGGDITKGAALRTMYAIKRMNDAHAENTARYEERIAQTKRHIDHHNAKPKEGEELEGLPDKRKEKIIDDEEQCVACHPKHFSSSTPEEARMARDGARTSSIKHKRVMVPQLDFIFNTLTNEDEYIPLFSDDESKTSLAKIAHHVLGEGTEFSTFKSKLERKAKYYQGGRDGVRREIKNQIRKAALKYNEKIEDLDVEFPGIKFKDEKIQPMGGARSSAAQRVAIGHIAGSNFMGDEEREQLRLDNLFNAQMGGLVEALEIMNDVEDGKYQYKEGKKKYNYKVKDFKGRSDIKKFIVNNSKDINLAKKNEAKLRRYQMLQEHLGGIEERYQLAMDAWNKEFGKRVESGNLQEKVNPKGHAIAMQQKAAIAQQHADELNERLHAIRDGHVDMVQDAQMGQREIEIPRYAMGLHNIKIGDSQITVGSLSHLSNQTYRIVDSRPPRKQGENYRLVLDKPLIENVEAGRGAIRFTEVPKNSFLQAGKTLFFEKEAFRDGVKNPADYFKRMKNRISGIESKTEIVRNDEEYNKRRNEYALGALVNCMSYNEKKKKYENLLAPILKEKDEKKQLNMLLKLREQLYTGDDGFPLSTVFMADGEGNTRQSTLYAPDEYMVGQMGASGGTGLTFMDNNKHLPNLSDMAVLQAHSRKYNKRGLSRKQMNAILDAQYNEADMTRARLDILTGNKTIEEEEKEMTENEIAKAIQNSHYTDEELKRIKNGESFDVPFSRGGATACGTCGGNRAVTMNDAISYIRAHNPLLRNAHPQSKAMREHIRKHLRPPNKENFEGSRKEPHEHHHVTCPDCDHENEDSPTGRCADGVCSQCHGHGILHPDDDDWLKGYSMVDDNGVEHSYEGERHNPHHGKSFTTDTLQEKLGRVMGVKGRPSTKSMALEVFKDNVARGMFAPLTNMGTIRELNAKRYGGGDEARRREKTFQDLVAQFRAEQGEEDASPRQMAPASMEDAIERLAQQPQDSAGIDQLPESEVKSDALMRAYHENMIEVRASNMANTAIENGQDKDEVLELLNTVLNHPDKSMSHGDEEHEVSEAMERLHDYATRHLVRSEKQQFSVDKEGRLRGDNPSEYSSLIYEHGRFQTPFESLREIFHPKNAGKPYVMDVEDVLHLFRHSPEFTQAWNRHTGESGFDEEEANKMLNLVTTGRADDKEANDAREKGVKYTPMVKQKLTKMSHPALSALLDEFGFDADRRVDFENVETSSAEPTWTDEIKNQMKQSKRNLYFSRDLKEGEYVHGPVKRKGLDAEYNAEVRNAVKPMWHQFALLTGLKQLCEEYDGLSHVGLHEKIVSANKRVGLSADTRMSPGNFLTLIQNDTPLMTQAYNEAARMLGFQDENDMEKKLTMSKKVAGLKGDDFKEEILNDAKPADVTPHSIPNAQQVFKESVAVNYSASEEARQQDKQMHDLMWKVAEHEYTPNVVYDQKMMDLMEKGGFASAEEVSQAASEGKLNQAEMKEFENVIKGINGFHPTWQHGRFDDLHIYDSIAHRRHAGTPIQSTAQRPVSLAPPVAPQKQPTTVSQMPSPRIPMTPQQQLETAGLPQFQLFPRPNVPQLGEDDSQ